MPTLAEPTKFRGEITVASRIIDYLSSGLYPTPAACLKELINNAYDADATRVNVFVKPDADRIIIEDDGSGMNREEFERHFRRISESHKRDGSTATAAGRPKIGKIGIGFIAANEICQVMEIYSTKRGSAELLHVTIDFDEMRRPAEERRHPNGDFVKADYEGEVLEADRAAHYTRLFLTGIRAPVQQVMAGADAQRKDATARSLYGLTAEEVAATLRSPIPGSWKDFDAYSETMLHIALNVPVPYADRWLPTRLRERVADFERDAVAVGFAVTYDGTALRKPVLHPLDADGAFVSRFDFEGEHVAAHGYFYAQHGTIRPRELQGLLVRIRHAAVGDFDPGYWGFPATESSLIQRWVSAEIWADDRLEDAMNIDRRTLRTTYPPYVELRNAVHAHLRQVLRRARKDIYSAGTAERSAQRAATESRDIVDIAESVVAPISRAAARALTKSWTRDDVGTRVQLLKKFSVAELYRAVIDVAKEMLTPEQLSEFLKRLTERLGR